MFRSRNHDRVLRGGRSTSRKRGHADRNFNRRRFWVERLEERYMLSGSPLVASPDAPLNLQSPTQSHAAAASSLMPVAPFPLEQTFLLHSDPTASKTIYLDFKGHGTEHTAWNSSAYPFIQTPAFSLDSDFTSFSDAERLFIQSVWERVTEDFRPFDVDVTTEDPGVEALQNSGGADNQWGIRVVIGGSTYDWYTPKNNGSVKAGSSFWNSFSWDNDTPAFVFAQDFFGSDKYTADVISNVTGHSLGLDPDGQNRQYYDISDPDPTKWDWKTKTDQYYSGHPNPPTGAPTDWGPIMGIPYNVDLSQWSQGEYWGSTNIQDDLAIITNSQNGFGYRVDDHPSTIATANPLAIDPTTIDSDVQVFSDEGIIERNTDVDVFSFKVEGLGEVVDLNIDPFTNGPNLDILAKIRDASGNVVATSNPRDGLSAGSQTLNLYSDGGWLTAGGIYTDSLFLAPGTYYVSVEGTGRPITFIDPHAHPPFQPPPPAPPGPNDPLDASDWGYTKYGSLGYYSITGTKSRGLVVGVDFDASGGTSPTNWNLYTGGGPNDQLTNLISEAGVLVPYTLSISTTGSQIDSQSSSNVINGTDIPTHTPDLDGLDGYIAAQGDTWTFTWSNLAPATVYQVYVFGHADFDARNVVTVTGGQWNNQPQTFNFIQDVSPDGLVVNDNDPGSDDLTTLALLVISDDFGQIKINVTNQSGYQAALGGLAIAPTKVGSISGQKWNDVDGNQIKDPTEARLPGWIIYLDLNNNGDLDRHTTNDGDITQASIDIPQAIPDADLAGVKSALTFTQPGTILDVNVTLNITHTYDADLNVYLISPSGTIVTLFGDTPDHVPHDVGGSGDNFTNTTFDDSATRAIADPTNSAPFTGTFRPQEPLSAFNGENIVGTWKLLVIDDGDNDVGVLNSWSMTVKVAGVTTYDEPYVITDASGNYSFPDLQPGLYYVREFVQPQQQLDGWRKTWAPTPIMLRSGVDLANVDFGNWIPGTQFGSIRGQKYYDANQNGVKDDQEPGLAGWIVYIDANGNGFRDQAGAAEVLTNSDPKPILDPPVPATTSQIIVNTLGTVANIEVTLNITHSFVGDLNAYLVSPSGRTVELFTEVGGQYNNFDNLTLSDAAARSIATMGFGDWGPTGYTGTWRPEGLLSDFIGEDAFGTWTLVISDTDLHDQGMLNSWSLSIKKGEVYRTTDADGYYEFDNLRPGSYIVREEQQPNWIQMPPATTDIPGATWANSQWNVTVVGYDDFDDPDGPDSHRNVQDADFGNYAPLGSLQGQVYNDLNGDHSKALTDPGLSGWVVFIDSVTDLTPPGTLDTDIVDETVFSETAQAINSFFPVSSKLWFGELCSITHVVIQLDISHTYDADLTVYLVSPSGTRVKLFSGIGGSGDDFQDTVFDDSAAQSITTGSAPFNGVFKPQELLSAFNGENAVGFWTLEITDSSAVDDGTLNGWSLSIRGDELSTVTDANGNYSFHNLIPGSYSVATVLKPNWIRTEVPGPVTIPPGQNVLSVNFGNRLPVVLAGDYNRDGVVDGADYIVWRRAFGASVPNYSGADGDGNGVVDQADFEVWRAHFGQTAPVPAPIPASVPLVQAVNSGGTAAASGSPVLQQSQVSEAVEASSDLQPVSTEPLITESISTEPASTEPALLSPQVLPVVTVAKAADLSNGLLGRLQEFELGGQSTVSEHRTLGVERALESTSQSDLALLAWLATSSDGNRPPADWNPLSDSDSTASSSCGESETLDAAFEMLEGSALAAAGI